MPAYIPADADRLQSMAISTGDMEVALAFYELEARFVVAPGNVGTGSEAIRQVMSEFLALQPTLTLEKVMVGQTGDIALLSSICSLAGTGPDGKPVSMSDQRQEVVRRQPDGTWRFVVDAPNGLG